MSSRKPLHISGKSKVVIHAFFIFYAAICILPLVLVLSISLSDETTVIANGYKFIPERFSISAYDFLFKDMEQIVRSYGVSIFVTVVGTVISVALTAFYAYPLSRRDLPYKGFFAFFIFFTMLFNGGLVPWYLVYVNLLDLKNTLWVLIMPMLMSPFLYSSCGPSSPIPYLSRFLNLREWMEQESCGHLSELCCRYHFPYLLR